MKYIPILLLVVGFTNTSYGQKPPPPPPKQEVENTSSGYQIGDTAEDFKLKNVNGEWFSLSMVDDAKGYIVVFTSNECPFALAYEDRLIELHLEMAPKGYPVIAINANDGAEGNGNSEQDMINRSNEKNFPFVYLKDAQQTVYPKYGATKTPHVFLLDKDLTVRYIGAIDDNAYAPDEVEERYVAQAIAALEMGKSPNPATTKAIGCPIASKSGNGKKGPPPPDKIMEMMDTNNDQQLSKSEVHGPLEKDFDRLDQNKDGFLTIEELSKLKKPE